MARPPALRPARRVLLPPLIAMAARSLGWSLRFHRQGQAAVEAALADGPVIFAFWHGEQLPLSLAHRDRGYLGLASLSRDGELLAGVIRRLGYSVARGSSSRGGAMALRACLRAMEQGLSPALAVDGPRGPRHRAAAGAVALSAMSHRPIACVACRCSAALRLPSWDHFLLPLPFSRIEVSYRLLPAIGGQDREAIEQGRSLLEETLRRATAGADRAA